MQSRTKRLVASGTIAALVGGLVVAHGDPAGAQRYQGALRVSSQTSGQAGSPDLSEDGRFVAFISSAALVGTDANGVDDAYVFDRGANSTTLISATPGGAAGNGPTSSVSISADGKKVAFQSAASNLVASDTNGALDVFVRDLASSTTVRASVSTAEAQASGDSTLAPGRGISANGRHVAFTSAAPDLVEDDVNISTDVFVRDLQLTTTQRVSINDELDASNSSSSDADISSNGDSVVFVSSASNLVQGDYNAQDDVFVHRRAAETTQLVSRALDGGPSNDTSGSPAISGDGTVVAFTSLASNLIASDTNAVRDVFTRTLASGSTERVSVSSSQAPATTASGGPAISSTGRYVAFTTSAQLVALDGNASDDVVVRDRTFGTTSLASRTAAGGFPSSGSDQASISADGLHTAFRSTANDVVTPDPNAGADAFVTDAAAFTVDPFATVDLFIRRQYLDFALRQPTTAELNADRAALTNNTLTPQALIDRLAHAAAWDGNGAPVVRLYAASFVRIPDAKGVTYWINRRRNGTTLTKMAATFVASSEFIRRYGSLSNAEYVDRVYLNVLGRPGDPGGRSYWTKKLNAGTSRGTVMVGFSESSEYIRKNETRVNSILLRLGMFQNTPNVDELNADLGAFSSIGYQRRVTQLLYGDQYATRIATL